LFKIAQNKLFDIQRHNKCIKESNWDDIIESTYSKNIRPDHYVIKKEISSILHKNIKTLTEKQQKVIKSRLDDLSFKDISIHEKTNINNILHRFLLAKRNLNKKMLHLTKEN
jgi:DNA-directed RNA polymerase specialized sigma24 family protein